MQRQVHSLHPQFSKACTTTRCGQYQIVKSETTDRWASKGVLEVYDESGTEWFGVATSLHDKPLFVHTPPPKNLWQPLNLNPKGADNEFQFLPDEIVLTIFELLQDSLVLEEPLHRPIGEDGPPLHTQKMDEPTQDLDLPAITSLTKCLTVCKQWYVKPPPPN